MFGRDFGAEGEGEEEGEEGEGGEGEGGEAHDWGGGFFGWDGGASLVGSEIVKRIRKDQWRI